MVISMRRSAEITPFKFTSNFLLCVWNGSDTSLPRAERERGVRLHQGRPPLDTYPFAFCKRFSNSMFFGQAQRTFGQIVSQHTHHTTSHSFRSPTAYHKGIIIQKYAMLRRLITGHWMPTPVATASGRQFRQLCRRCQFRQLCAQTP